MRIAIFILGLLAVVALAPLVVEARPGTPVATLSPEECGPGEPESPSEPTCTPAPTLAAVTATPAPSTAASSTVTPDVLGAQHGPSATQPEGLPETGGQP